MLEKKTLLCLKKLMLSRQKEYIFGKCENKYYGINDDGNSDTDYTDENGEDTY